MERKSKFVLLHRTNGSGVACRIAQVLFVGRGESGAILNFPGGAQVNVHEGFDEVMALLEDTR